MNLPLNAKTFLNKPSKISFNLLCFAEEHMLHPTASLHASGNSAESGGACLECQPLPIVFITQTAFLVSLLKVAYVQLQSFLLLPPTHFSTALTFDPQSAVILEEMMGKQNKEAQ